MGKHLVLWLLLAACAAFLALGASAEDSEADTLRAEIALMKQRLRAADERYTTDIGLKDSEIGELRGRLAMAQREINKLTRDREVALAAAQANAAAGKTLAMTKERVRTLETAIATQTQAEARKRDLMGGILVELGESAVPLMVKALDHDGTYEGAFLSRYLGRMGKSAKAAIPALEKLAQQDVPEAALARVALAAIRK